MKKVSLIFVTLIFTVVRAVYAQEDADFFVGNWDVVFIGTPQGDAQMVAEISRDNGDLQGVLVFEENAEPIPITEIIEDGDQLTLYFSAQGYDVNVVLKKVDDNNLKGSLMNMFDATASRVLEQDYYTGMWELMFMGTPNGDAKLMADLSRKEGVLVGSITTEGGAEVIPITEVVEEEESITLYFTIQGYDVNVLYNKVDANNMKGSLMSMFDATAVRL
ncbi:MAG: hypothetical protein NXI00_15525 [Cytophagales bacterium]|nr:hypothetical protein [Cytophagales bacterium]